MDYTNIIPYSTFRYWFHREPSRRFTVVDITRNQKVGDLQETAPGQGFLMTDSTADFNGILKDVYLDFHKFYEGRPEYAVGAYFDTSDHSNLQKASDHYCRCVVGVALIRAKRNEVEDPDVCIPKISKCINWLGSSGFFEGPSSTKYHEAFEGGNMIHALNVVNCITDLWELPIFNLYVNIEDAVLVALVHDWCKIGAYESYTKKQPDPKTGNWVPTKAWKYRDNILPLGHGVASMILANKFFKLSEDEMLAIRWHMGHWRVCESEVNDLQQANESKPLVHMLQFADQLAITKYEPETRRYLSTNTLLDAANHTNM